MNSQKKLDTKILYLSEKLKKSFETFGQHPCTVIEAPMGYGKTTSVKAALNTIECNKIWQKVYDKGAAEFWKGFCQAISKIDEKCGKALLNIGMLEDGLMRRELMMLLEEIQISKTTFIVIDDYHYVKSETADDFLRLLISNMPQDLHLIIITRVAFLNNSRELQVKGILNYIGMKTLKFSPSDIKKYFRLLGLNIKAEEQEEIYRYSEGWISGIYLLALEYKMYGIFKFSSNVSELVYETVYQPLEDELKSFLITICHFEDFNLEQAHYMWQQNNAKELLDQLMLSNAFITQDSINGKYSFHNIFANCLKEEFMSQEEKIKNAVWIQMGEKFYLDKEYISSMDAFYNGGDFDGILKALEGDQAKGIYNEKKEALIQYYKECPLKIKKRHPLAILVYAILMATQFRERELFAEACSEFLLCLEDNDEFQQEEKNQLLGEYEVLQTFTAYNDLIKIREHNAKAYTLLKHSPRFINMRNSFTFGSPSILYLYYRESGKLKELFEYLDKSTSYYEKITEGHGNGYTFLFKAEWYYHMGDFENAEITLYQALPRAKEAEQIDIVLCGLFFLSTISMVKGDFKRVIALLGQMEDTAKLEIEKNQSYWMIYTVDICKGYIYACLDQADNIPQWIYEYEYTKHMNFLSIAFANIVYGKALLLKGKNAMLLGNAEQLLKQASIFPNLLAIIYTNIYVAIASYKLNRTEECDFAIKEALNMAMADNLIMPFVENAKSLGPVFENLFGEKKYQEFIKKILKVSEEYNEAIRKINQEYFEIEIPRLTQREKEIALLVIQGLNNKGISDKLYISPNTVKAELKSIFKKCKINSRVLLKEEMIM